jgi:hypothetical protein
MIKKLLLNTAAVLAIASPVIIAGCTTAQLTQAQTDISTGIAAACKDVSAVAALNPSSPVGSYATAACGTATAVASLVQSSDTIQWLGSLQAQIAAKPATP